MLSKLVLRNFRKHSFIELDFDESQLVYITGNNGVGKSSLLEAILFGLYGESRHGRKDLDSLVKRGSEIEGMQVDLEFKVGSDFYRVSRRREGRLATAVLYGNDIPLHEGSAAVTNAITQILGMDSATFKIAVISQQKEIDGLTSLKPSERVDAVKKMLRLDRLAKARDFCYEMYKDAKKSSLLLRPSADRDTFLNEINDLKSQLSTLRAEKEIVQLEHNEVNSRLASVANLESAYNSLLSVKESMRLSLINEEKILDQFKIEYDSIKTHNISDKCRPVNVILEELSKLQYLQKKLEDSSSLKSQIEFHLQEIKLCENRLSVLDVLNSDEILSDIKLLENEKRSIIEKKNEEECKLSSLERELTALQASIDFYAHERSYTEGCPSCFREVPISEVDNIRSKSAERLKKDENAKSVLHNLVKEQNKILSNLGLDLQHKSDLVATKLGVMVKNDSVKKEHDDLLIRLKSHKYQYKNLQEEFTNTVDYSNEIAALSDELKFAKTQQLHMEENSVLLARKEELLRSINIFTQKISSLRSEIDTDIDPELVKSHSVYATLLENLVTIKNKIDSLNYQIAHVTTIISVKVSELERFDSDLKKSNIFEEKALINFKSSKVLDTAIVRLSNSAIPHLEHSLGSILESMSGGRFSSVRISSDYTISVLDNGDYRSLNDLSGGEFDLVSLALRLSLTDILLDTVGNSAGFLILDECFGSQDASRRNSILEGLRGIKDRFTQILLISHVENVDDFADRVIDIGSTEE
ncbi:MAG: AAA family ATPase [Candidatus Paceibacterota bacterium]